MWLRPVVLYPIIAYVCCGQISRPYQRHLGAVEAIVRMSVPITTLSPFFTIIWHSFYQVATWYARHIAYITLYLVNRQFPHAFEQRCV